MDQKRAEEIADSHLETVLDDVHGHRVTCVRGLPEEVTAMLFAFFSRNPKDLRTTLVSMIQSGNLPLEAPYDGMATTNRAKRFHEKTTIGYGHKSVADHATLHWAIEGGSAVSERDWLSARLLAATGKSTRYVDFRDAGFALPHSFKLSRDRMEDHCNQLLTAYESLIDPATVAVRKLLPYEGEALEMWKTEKGWENATAKRALDMVRDLLPASIRTSFGVTCSATALREMTDKRRTDGPVEVKAQAEAVNTVCRSVCPTLLPVAGREIPRYVRRAPPMSLSATPDGRTMKGHRITMLKRPDWDVVQLISGRSIPDVIRGWIHERGHHMPPDRTAEAAIYVMDCVLPWAIHRDLGRHRMMTQIEGALTPNLGYGADPLLFHFSEMIRNNPTLALVAKAHQQALMAADKRLIAMATEEEDDVIQYLCPLAAMVPVKYVMNARELVHFLGLRTIAQGHASYRLFTQMLGNEVKRVDPLMASLVDEVTNFNHVVIGRPG